MRVRDFLVSTRIHLFRPEETIKDASSVFRDLKIDASPVVNTDGALIGLFTKSHVFKAIKDGMSMETPIGELMTKNVIAGHPDDDVEDRFYFKHGYLPVVEKAWKYLTTVALQPDGRLGYVQPIGEKAIAGQIVDAQSTANFGVGAFLLAACEMVKFCNRQ